MPRREALYVKFGVVVSYYRVHRLEVTQLELAKLTKRTRAAIANIEAGRQRIYLKDVLVFAEAFKIDPCVLIREVQKVRK